MLLGLENGSADMVSISTQTLSLFNNNYASTDLLDQV